jgi:hypothetical protein
VVTHCIPSTATLLPFCAPSYAYQPDLPLLRAFVSGLASLSSGQCRDPLSKRGNLEILPSRALISRVPIMTSQRWTSGDSCTYYNHQVVRQHRPEMPLFENVPGFEPTDLTLFREYFRQTGDRESLFWTLSPHRSSDFLRRNLDIAHGKERYRIIDHLAGRQPILANYDSLVNDLNTIRFIPTILLDSNVMAYLNAYVTGGISSRSSRRGFATKNLLTKLVSLGWDYNPLFYYMETLTRNAFETTFPHARHFAETILRLHTMDEAYFLKSGDIRPDEKQVAKYLEQDNVQTLSELAERHVRDGASSMPQHMPTDVLQLTYACLLKAGILNSAKISQRRKMETFFDFVRSQLGLQLAREELVAGLHFRSKAGNLIPIHPNYKKDFKARIMASAWDIMLLRMPELLLSWGGQQETTLAYVCTGDTTLQDLGAMFTVLRVTKLKENNYATISQLFFDEGAIKRLLGAEIAGVVLGTYGSKEIREQGRPSLERQKIEKIVSSLEDEVSNIMAST